MPNSTPQRRPSGVPGDKQAARQRGAKRRRRALDVLLGVSCWVALTFLVGPPVVRYTLPPPGPAQQDIVALRDFNYVQVVPDIEERLQEAAKRVPVHYRVAADAADEQITRIRKAFSLVRPKHRLYRDRRARLQQEIQEKRAKAQAEQRNTRRTRRKKGRGKTRKAARPVDDGAELLAALERSADEQMKSLRLDFARLLLGEDAKVSVESFATLREHGFAEEIELLLSDVAKAVLQKRIVAHKERFEDDLLAPGVFDVSTGDRLDRASAVDVVVDLAQARKLASQYADKFVKSKSPSRFDNAVLHDVAKTVIRLMIRPTYKRDLAATEARVEAEKKGVPRTTKVHYKANQILVRKSDDVTVDKLALIAAMYRGVDTRDTLRGYIATALLLGGMLLLLAGFAARYITELRRRPGDARLLITILLVHALALRLLLELGDEVVSPTSGVTATMWAVLLPFALGPTLATVFLRPATAAPFALPTTGVATLMALNSPLLRATEGLVALVSVASLVLGVAGIFATRRFRQRADLVISALMVSGFGMAVAVGVALFTTPETMDVLRLQNALLVAMGAGSGMLSYLLVAALTPIFESIFNRLTDIKLLELSSMNHPALRLLSTEAPGTFTHSVMVGNLAEAACDAIGANGLLARVGAYYHDLGKTNAPRYFAENQSGDNPHDRLKPHLSALIIKSHVKDGIKILEGFGLPQEIIDCVPEHHGNGRIEHFYNLARREAQAAGGDAVVESDFRYPGPKPRSKETAALMIADTVEAAAKALPDPNPNRIQALVQRLIARKLEDGQFDECDMTLRELALVEKALTHVLVGMHHTRPVYLPPPKRTDRASVLATARAMRRSSSTANPEVATPAANVSETMRMTEVAFEDTDEPQDAGESRGDEEEPPPRPDAPTAGNRPTSPTAVVSARRKSAG